MLCPFGGWSHVRWFEAFPSELPEWAVLTVFEHPGEYAAQWKAICAIVELLGVNQKRLRVWVRAEVDQGTAPG